MPTLQTAKGRALRTKRLALKKGKQLLTLCVYSVDSAFEDYYYPLS
jgi:hypothetical protein